MTPTNPNRSETLGIGVLGAGAFGLFALQHFLQVPGVRLVALAGTHREAALAMARRFGLEQTDTPESLVQRPDVDLVYIATPPFLHHPQARMALEAGKHVLCEKPLALTTREAAELVELARARNLLCVANLIQRYNPLFDAIRSLIAEGVLGACLHGYFENYAADEGLPPRHWFWDRSKSGGIFLEHGVHFFDLFAGWLGPGRVVAAQSVARPGSGVEEQVHCTVRYPGDVLVNFYHGFTQPARMDRQELRLLFELGDVTLEEWIPVRATVRAVVDEARTRRLMELFPGARLDILAVYGGRDREAMGRHKKLDLSQRIELRWGPGQEKMRCYGELLRALLLDQIRWIRDPSHARKITEENGWQSVAMAEAATRLAGETAPAEDPQRVAPRVNLP